MNKLIDLSDALEIILDRAGVLSTETVDLRQAFNRVLAEDIIADIAVPPFNKSAVDGYALRQEDTDKELQVTEVIPAGKEPERIIGPGQCAKIMTGAKIPKGADRVIMKEDTEPIDEETIRINRKSLKTNICLRGEDISEGASVLQRGTKLQPSQIALLASMGIHRPKVYKRPGIALLATGSELVEPGTRITQAKIRNSNSYQLMAQLDRLGITADYLGIIQDDEKNLRSTIMDSQKKYDLLLVTGGVSVGDFDLMPSILVQAGFELLIEKLAIQPGKPMKFAVKQNRYCFALSGNPVSSYLQFELLVVPFLNKLMGTGYSEKEYPVEMLSGYQRKKAQRDLFLPVSVQQGKAEIVRYNGSAHIEAYTRANAIIKVEKNKFEIHPGEKVYARPI